MQKPQNFLPLFHFLVRDIPVLLSVTSIFFDMSKAFDFVLHNILLHKCDLYGIRGIANEWLNSYLSDRTQYVEITKINSDMELSTYRSSTKLTAVGVPQGSVLGPLLFLLYINDLPDVSKYECVLFADDVSVVIPCNDTQTYNAEINNTIYEIIKWMNNNNLNVNLNKTTYIQFINKNGKKHNLNVLFENQAIKESLNIMFLGIVLDNRCSWADHIEKLCSRINSFAYALWRLTKISDKKVAIQAYHGYVSSLLRYAILLWGSSCHADRVLIAQKQCIRAICNVDSMTSCRPLFRELKLLTVPCMYIFEICIFVKTSFHLFKQKKDKCNFNRRFPEKLILPAKTTALYSRNAYCMAIKIYNSLCDEFKGLPLNSFKTKLRDWLTHNSFYFKDEFFKSLQSRI